MSDDQNVMRAMGRIEGALAAIKDGMNEIKESAIAYRLEHAAAIKEHDARIAKLERSKAYLVGAAAACGTVAGYLSKYLTGGAPQ